MTRYDETRRVELPDGFWVEIKVNLTGKKKAELERVRVQRGIEREKDPRTGEETGKVNSVVTGINTEAYYYELAIASIVDWNLPGGDDQDPKDKWPLEPEGAKRAHYNNLDENDKDAVETACVEGNAEPTREEDAQFPADGERGVSEREVEAPDDREVLDGAEVLAGAGNPSGPPTT